MRRIFSSADYWGAVLVAVILLAGTWLACVVQLSALRERANGDAQTRVVQLAGSYQGDVLSTISLADNILRFIAAYDAENGIARTGALVEREHLYRGVIGNVAVTDASGHGRAFGAKGSAPISLGDRDYVKAALKTRNLVIGAPVMARVTKHLAIPFARSVLVNGKIAGAVTAVIDVDAFSFGYSKNDFGPHGIVEIVGADDQIIRARISADNAQAHLVGRKITAKTLAWKQPNAPDAGSYTLRSSLDNTVRIFSYRRVAGYPVVVIAGLAYDDIAEQTEGIRHMVIITAAVATIIILIFLLAWMHQVSVRKQLRALQIQEAQAKEEALEATKAALSATAAKSEFLANMSHEIRTPMNGVIGLTHLALMTELTPKQRDYLNKIEYSAKSLLNIINDILDFSKIEAGKLDLEDVSFDLGSVLENIGSVAEMRARDKNIGFSIKVAGGVPAELIGDPVRYGQILLNLVTNAIKFTETGRVTVDVALARESGREIELITTVRDTGIGMNEADQSRLFQSFSQADASITRRFGGTGLGLAISKALTEKMGGAIGVESVAGQGSTFTFSVVLHRAERRAIKRTLPELEGRHVLVVDDDAIAREALVETLRTWKLDVASAASGAAALAAVHEARAMGSPFELVLMDWKMPGQNGVEVAEAIHVDSAGSKAPIVVMVSAFGRADVFASAKRAGIDSFLVKPVNPSLLLETLQSLFAISSGARESVPSPVMTPSEQLKGSRVLVAEDNAINQQIVQHLLERLGMNVAFAQNGQEAVDKALAPDANYDAVIMDVQMPVMDGLEATRIIRRTIPESKLPIIAMTAHAMEQERKMCLDAGMNDHLTKPVDPKSLTKTLTKWIHVSRATDVAAAVVTSDVEGQPQ